MRLRPIAPRHFIALIMCAAAAWGIVLGQRVAGPHWSQLVLVALILAVLVRTCVLIVQENAR